MQCITVFPILKNTFREKLMYWTRESCSLGDVIQIHIQNRKVWAVVAHIASVYEVKEFIKSQSFAIKKIDTIIKTDIFSTEFILAVLETSRYFVKSFGDIFSELVPKKVLEQLDNSVQKQKQLDNSPLSTAHTLISSIEKPTSPRITMFKRFESEAEIFIVSPLKSHTTSLKKHGLHNVYMPIDLYKLDQYNPSQAICILELASSAYYRHIRKDFDIRFFVRDFCKRKKIHLIESDTVLLESDQKNPLPSKPDIHLINMKETGSAKTKTKDGFIKKQPLLSPELVSLLHHCQKHNESIFLYVVRKGFSHQTICGDCSSPVLCSICKKPLRLTAEKQFVCDMCKTTEDSNRACAVCGGWNLIPFGATTELVAEYIRELFSTPVHIIDGDHETKSSARKKMQEKAGIYVGTELLLTQSYNISYTYGVIISLETILAIPDSLAELKAAQAVYTLSDRVQKDLLIQTRSEGSSLWKALEQKDWNILSTALQTQLKETGLPPYVTSIQIQANTGDINTIENHIQRYVQTYIRSNNTIHITIPNNVWPHHPLQPYLQALPRHIQIAVDKTDFM